MLSSRKIITLALAIAALALSATSASADAPSTPGYENYGFGEVKRCTTGWQIGNLGQYGAWGRYVDGCTVRVRCYFEEGCTVNGYSTIRNQRLRNRRVTLNSRLRILDSSGTTPRRWFDRSCDSSNYCTAAHLSTGLAHGDVASVQCNGVQQVARGRVTCGIHVYRGYLALGLKGAPVKKCEDAHTPVDQLSQQAAEAAVLCLTNVERWRMKLPGLVYSRTLSDAARGHATESATQKWWDSRDPNRFDANSPHNPHRSPDGRQPQDRINAAGYCPGVKFRTNVRPENTFTSASWGTAPAATPYDAVEWWMNHHIKDGIPVEQNGHRAAILDPAALELGSGVADGTADPSLRADKGSTFVQTFGACSS